MVVHCHSLHIIVGSDERGYFQNKKLQKKDDDKDDADEIEDLNDSNFDEVCLCVLVQCV